MSSQAIGIVGCGWMGTGLAELAAVAGFDVVAVKATPGPLDEVAARIERSMAHAVTKGRLEPEARDRAKARIAITTDMSRLNSCDLVVESTIESLVEKQQVLAEIEMALAPEAILASNTSSLPLARLAEGLSDPHRFLGLHFFSPAPAVKLVEVAPLATTEPAVIERACAVAQALGKTAILTGDGPGYVVNRLLVPYLCHAIEMLESGVASATDVDTAMKLGCGHPMGPLELSDFIGLDVVLAMAQSLQGEHQDKRFRAPALLRRLVLQGHLGKKTLVGLYDYRTGKRAENPTLRSSVAGS